MARAVTDRRLDRLAEGLGELVEQHASAADLDSFAHYADDPGGFLKDVLGARLWSRQEDVAGLVRDNPRVVVRGAHGMGKDFVLARLLLWHVYARGGLAIYTAPTDRQLEIGMREVRAAFRHARTLPGELLTRALRIDGEPRLMAFTSANVDNLTGWHDVNGVMVGISEGQGERVEDVSYDAAFAVTTEPGSRLVVVGNPTKRSGRFYEISKRSNWAAVKLPAADFPNIAEGRRVVPYGPAPDWPDQIAEEYGRDSAFYTSRVLAEFPEDDVDQLIRRAWVERAFELGRDSDFTLASRRLTPHITVDVARTGADRCAAVVARGRRKVERLITWRSDDLMDTARRVAALAAEISKREWSRNGRNGEPRPVPVTVDVIGLGAGVHDRLAELGGLSVRGFNASKSGGPKFANARARGYWGLREALAAEALALPEVDGLADELCAHQWSVDGAGRLIVASKDDVRSQLGRSPDLADTVMMVFASGRWPDTSRKVW